MSLDPALLRLVAATNLGALVTLKRDGRPQLSTINYEYDADRQRVASRSRTAGPRPSTRAATPAPRCM